MNSELIIYSKELQEFLIYEINLHYYVIIHIIKQCGSIKNVECFFLIKIQIFNQIY